MKSHNTEEVSVWYLTEAVLMKSHCTVLRGSFEISQYWGVLSKTEAAHEISYWGSFCNKIPKYWGSLYEIQKYLGSSFEIPQHSGSSFEIPQYWSSSVDITQSWGSL